MPLDIIIPEFGESVPSGVIARWIKKDGEQVKRDEPVLELETDKVTAEIVAPGDGVLRHGAKAGDTVLVKTSVGTVDPAGVPSASVASPQAATPIASTPTPASSPTLATASNGHAGTEVRATPLARKVAEEAGVNLAAIAGTGPGGRVRESDVLAARQTGGQTGTALPPSLPSTPGVAAQQQAQPKQPAAPARRERLSPLRQRIAQRLVEAQHTAAMLTTFNEVDMTQVMALRGKYKEEFEKKHGVGLGFMSFFVKAAASALMKMPTVNAYLVPGASGVEVEYHASADIAVAVSTPKGLTVPVLRNAQALSFAQVESGIKDLATRARDGKLALEDLQGGTFTITNGGIFGSMMSTPILNAPQSAILGMHTIKNRPVEHPEKPGEIALRPMMYLALSYDHRILDGSDAVTFLVAIKNAIERPEKLLLDL
jgi:2-oxoglutarate dehydrogenase E2 component (dihydrolipoamide succinyltransferase)